MEQVRTSSGNSSYDNSVDQGGGDIPKCQMDSSTQVKAGLEAVLLLKLC